MRIVMLTDDVQIDRRILLEAESLHSRGHEVILIAEHLAGTDHFERIGNVKVERLRPPELSDGERFLLRLFAMINMGLSRTSSAVQGALSLLTRLSSNFFSLLIRIFSGVVSRVSRVVQAALCFLLRLVRGGLSLLIRLSSNFFSLVIRIFNAIVSRVSRAVNAALSFLSRVVSKTLSFTIRLNQWATGVGLRVIRRLRRMPLRERALIDRIVFYSADVIHAHDLPQLRAGAVAKKRLGVPLVYDAHELYPEIATLNAAQKQVLTRRERRYVRSADAVITVNKYIAEEMERRYDIRAPRVILNATNWPSELVRDGGAGRFRERFGICEDHRILLFQGWMSLQRGLQPLVYAMGMLPSELHLVFMGYGEGRDELARIARDEGLDSRVHFMDAVPQCELLAWTSSADAGMIPYQPVDLNNYYCSPNKLFEFIQAELPIVANDLPFLRDLVAGEGFGVVHRLNEPKDYAEAILEMFDGDTHERCKIRLKQRKSAYSWAVEEMKLFDVYATLDVGGQEYVAQVAS